MTKNKKPAESLAPSGFYEFLTNSEIRSGGEGGIRTPGTLRYAGFQDRYIRPLCHFTGSFPHSLNTRAGCKCKKPFYSSRGNFLKKYNRSLNHVLFLSKTPYFCCMTLHKLLLSSLLITALSAHGHCADTEGDPITAYFDYKNFYAPGQGSYIETYLSFVGHSIDYKLNEKGNYQGEVAVTQIIKIKDSIVAFQKYKLKSPIIGTDSTILDFVDQKRWVLEPGLYNYELEISDLTNPTKEHIISNQVLQVVDAPGNKLATSDIELLQSFKKSDVFSEWSKSGYEVIPYISTYFPPYIGKIAYYMEIYGSENALGIDERFVVNQYIEKATTLTRMDSYARFSKLSTEKVNVVFNSFNIEDLPTGKYNLVVEARNKSNQIVAEKKLFFERLNPMSTPDISSLQEIDYSHSFASDFRTEDSITEAIRCLSPIGTDIDNAIIQSQLETIEFETKKQFFYNFWKQRYPDNAEEKWMEYLTQVRQVNKLFGTPVKKGYITDRGRIYLKYGAPNTMTDRPNEPSSYPYQIWHYYKLGELSNRRFVFYLPDLVTNDYEILHSDMRGERQNYRWQIDLQKRTTPFNDLDNTNPLNGSHGSRSNELFTNPR